MQERTQKIVQTTILAGLGVGAILLIAKFHKKILHYFYRLRSNNPLYNQRIELVSTPDECQKVLDQLKKHCQNYSVLGFDCEWVTVNGARRKVALLQLSSAEGLCGLFRLCKMERLPRDLRDILEDSTILKVGVVPQTDASHLFTDYAVRMNATLDLRYLALQADTKAGGLAKLSKDILGVELDKDWRVSCSDWEANFLTKQQIEYAANDSHVAIEIFRRLFSKVNNIKNPTILDLMKYNESFVDIAFSNKLANDSPKQEKLLQKQIKDAVKVSKRHLSTRVRPLYDNCFLQAPDGQPLCAIERKKAEWYITRSLGVVVTDEPYTVRLSFEPSGRAVGECGKFYLTVKDNLCVVCGKTESLIRKNVVPREYRKCFPDVMKSHASHDIVLLCLNCHQKSNIYDHMLRLKLERLCNAPLHKELDNEKVDKEKKIQKIVKALCMPNSLIPEDRIKDLEKQLLSFYPNQKIIDLAFLDWVRNTSTSTKNQGLEFSGHGEIVVDYYKTNGEGLIVLERMWRLHFLEFMKPLFMPELWDVDHTETRLEIRADEGRIEVEDLIIAGVDTHKLNEFASHSSRVVVEIHPEISAVEPEMIAKQSVISESTPLQGILKSSKSPNSAKSSSSSIQQNPLNVPETSKSPNTSSFREKSPVPPAIQLNDQDWEADQADATDDDVDTTLEFQSVGSSRTVSESEENVTLRGDEGDTDFYSDLTLQSHYETIRSNASSVDFSDFKSFEASTTDKYAADSDDSTLSGSSTLSYDTDVGVDMEMDELKEENEKSVSKG